MRKTNLLRATGILALTSLALAWSSNAMAFGTIGMNFGNANTYGNEYATRNWEFNFSLSDGSSRNMVIGYIGGISAEDNALVNNDNGLDGLPLSGSNFTAEKRISTSSFNFGAKFGYVVPVLNNNVLLLPYAKLGLEKLTSTLTYSLYSPDLLKPNLRYKELVLNDSFNLQYGFGVTAYVANFSLGLEYSMTNLDGSQELRDAQSQVRSYYNTPAAGQARHAQTTFSVGYSF